MVKIMSTFLIGDRIQLSDSKDRKFTVVLSPGAQFHTHKGIINHDDLIGKNEGILVTSTQGHTYLALRPLLVDFVLSMPRGASIIYPKDSAQIISEGDIFPGAKVLEAGAGSGALTCSLLRAIGSTGQLVSMEIRTDHAQYTQKNVETFFGHSPDNWSLIINDITDQMLVNSSNYPILASESFDRIVLDMLDPDAALPAVSQYIKNGGVLICYIATVTQLAKVTEAIKHQGGWTAPRSWESLVRGWHVEGLAVRPNHRMQAHTAFLLMTRKLASGTIAPQKHLHSAKRFRMQQLDQASKNTTTENISYTTDPSDSLNE